MKRLLWWAVAILGSLALVVCVAVLLRDRMFKAYVARTLSERTGFRAEIDGLRTTLGRSVVSIQGLRLFNGDEFGGGVFVRVPELLVELDADAAAAGTLKFRRLEVDLAEVNVVRSRDGRNNLERLGNSLASGDGRGRRAGPAGGDTVEFGGIDCLIVSVGEAHYVDLRHPRRSRKLEIAVRDETVSGLKGVEELRTWGGAFLFRVFLQQLMGGPRGKVQPIGGASAQP